MEHMLTIILNQLNNFLIVDHNIVSIGIFLLGIIFSKYRVFFVLLGGLFNLYERKVEDENKKYLSCLGRGETEDVAVG